MYRSSATFNKQLSTQKNVYKLLKWLDRKIREVHCMKRPDQKLKRERRSEDIKDR